MLTPSQQEVLEKFETWLVSEDREFVITGYAGTGKSYLVPYLLEAIKCHRDLNLFLLDEEKDDFATEGYILCATTNKAAGVLAGFTGKDTWTIHKALGLVVYQDYSTGEEKLKETGRGLPDDTLRNNVIFIDEALMLDKHLLQLIRSKCNRIVYVGDPYQLPPIKHKVSPLVYLPNSQLTEIVRQKQNSCITTIGAQLRDILDNGTPFLWPEFNTKADIQVIDNQEFKGLIKNKFENSLNMNDVRILAYTNKRVIGYNNYIRRILGYEENLQPGDLVITNTPIMRPHSAYSTLYHTDETLEITNTEHGSYMVYEGIRYYEVTLNSNCIVHQPYNIAEVNFALKKYKKEKDWKSYFDHKNFFSDLRSGYALTCHKSQGSTYREVFIDIEDINKNTRWWDIARLLYVAITRASERVYVYGSLKNRNSHTMEI
jgi:ATP-dependent exoDNAse (exonuclease V) alpha subunit